MDHYYIYILRCVNDSLYTGVTNNITKRLKEHKKGSKSSKYTASFPPVRCEVCWKINKGRSEAQSIEASIKKLNKHEKNALITNPRLLRSIINNLTSIKDSVKMRTQKRFYDIDIENIPG